MFELNNCLTENIPILVQTPNLEEKLSENFPLEKFLENDDAILCAKIGGEKTKNYLNSTKMKKLIKLITEEPENDDQINGHKIPYIASEILKLDCPYILEHFVLSEKEYQEQYILFNNLSLNNSIDNEVDDIFSKIEKKYKNKEFQNKFDFQNIKNDDNINDSENKFDELIDNDKDNEDKKENISGIDNKDKDIYKNNNNDCNEDNYEENLDEINANNKKGIDININEKTNLKADKNENKININNINDNNCNEQKDEERSDENKLGGTDAKDKEIPNSENKDKEKYEKLDEEKNNIEDLTKDNKELIDGIYGIDDNYLSIEGELADFYICDTKENKLDDYDPHNEYLDLLLNFVINDKPELNYVLSGYFLNVIQILLEKYPSKIITYLYNIRKDALKRIVFLSHQSAFSILSSIVLNIESYKISLNSNNDIINNINFRNELFGNIIKSMNLEGFRDEAGKIYTEFDMESKLLLIFNLFNDNKYVVKYILEKRDIYMHLLGLLNINLFKDTSYDNKNFDKKYTLYSLYLNLIIKLLNVINLNEDYNFPNEYNFNYIKKSEDELSFNDYMILTFDNILKYNFIPKKPILIIGEGSGIEYEGLGRLNIKILDLVIELLKFMKNIPNIFDSILIKYNFVQNSIDYFFKYQWNNLYHQKLVILFDIYLKEERNHKELTEFIFDKYKLHEILVNYLKLRRNTESYAEKSKKFIFKSGKEINSGVYVHVIDLMYKIQVFAGLKTFADEEKQKLNIINLGEYEFLKSEKSNKDEKEIKISQNICNILKENKEWNDTIDNLVMPLIKKFEEKLVDVGEPKRNEKEDIFKDGIRNVSNNNIISIDKEGIDNSLEIIQKNINIISPPKLDIKKKRNKKKKKRKKKQIFEENLYGDDNNKKDITNCDNNNKIYNKDNYLEENKHHETKRTVNDIKEANDKQSNQEQIDKDICEDKNKEISLFNDEKIGKNIVSDIPDNKVILKEKSPQKEVNGILKNDIEKDSENKKEEEKF